jgi:hypothetical protein
VAMQNGLSRTEAISALDATDSVASSSSSVIEPPPPPSPPTDQKAVVDTKAVDSGPHELGRKGATSAAESTTMEKADAAPAGRWLFLLQAWGASPEDALELVARLIAAGGPLAQRADAGEIINNITNASYPKRDKLNRLTNKLLRMEHERARRDTILAGLGDGPKTLAQLAAIAGMTLDVASKLLSRMLREGEIIKTGHGTYTLPERSSETAYTPTDAAIINALLALPDFRGNIGQLIEGTGRDRIPVYDNAKRMSAPGGHLVRLTRGHGVKGVFELSTETLNKIRRGEPIRLGHKFVLFELPSLGIPPA